MLYQVAVLHKPTQDELDEGKLETILVPPTFIVALDEQRAALKIAVQHNALIEDDQQATFLVRAF